MSITCVTNLCIIKDERASDGRQTGEGRSQRARGEMGACRPHHVKQRGVGCAAARDADSAEGRAIYQRAVGHRQPGQSPQRPQDRHGSGPIQMLTWWSGFVSVLE